MTDLGNEVAYMVVVCSENYCFVEKEVCCGRGTVVNGCFVMDFGFGMRGAVDGCYCVVESFGYVLVAGS